MGFRGVGSSPRWGSDCERVFCPYILVFLKCLLREHQANWPEYVAGLNEYKLGVLHPGGMGQAFPCKAL
jgi:hypothetical protein